MPSYSWTLPSSSLSTSAGFGDDQGFDFHFDISGAKGPDLAVTAGGDWCVVNGAEALRQSLLRRYITAPGEWATKPNYGAGAGLYVRKQNSATNRDALAERLRSQTLADTRVELVHKVFVERSGGGMVKFLVSIKPRGMTMRTLDIAASLS